VTAWT